ncbi:hypothetical protein RchiOBHm_Chr1g0328301 [Rosa chinensis]|uniref:Uncharacterized protein n=1 Tax=Rosa chinensis TaxID=74649 RepID=A0A2P6SAQ2_ROSCH|nr:hypothetical protein RchiOBHm_Chr1g0328301 [Rosa chinensis]
MPNCPTAQDLQRFLASCRVVDWSDRRVGYLADCLGFWKSSGLLAFHGSMNCFFY